MILIYYYTQSRNTKIGSTNEQKIRSMAGNKPVYYCDIAKFDAMQGKLINRDWDGNYSSAHVDQINFKLPIHLNTNIIRNSRCEIILK